jgi:iron(III) transport system substrate-binding protein
LTILIVAGFFQNVKRILFGILLAGLTVVGCWSSAEQEVVVYTAIDPELCDPIYQDFLLETNIVVRPKYEADLARRGGLAEAILAERDRPRGDVLWSNEPLGALRLERQGLLEAYRPPMADNFPAMDRSPKGFWHGCAARARVLIVNTDLVSEKARPQSILDLAEPKWRGRCAIAQPLEGTMAAQAACLFAAWGRKRAEDFFRRLRDNHVQVLPGSKQVAQAVSGGILAFGLTDSDQALIEVEKGMPATIVHPDQQPGGIGTLFLPSTVAIIKGGPHPAAARRLVDFLLSPPVESSLAKGERALIPLNAAAIVKTRVPTPATVRPMQVDFEQAADAWGAAAAFLREEFLGKRE